MSAILFNPKYSITPRLLANIKRIAMLTVEGIDTFPLFSFENYYNQNIRRYFKEVGERGNYYELAPTMDFTSWLESFTEGIIDEILRVSVEIKQAAASPQQRLNSHDLQILEFIKTNGFITDRDYAQLTQRAKAT
jgi:hypothetical protein